MYRLFCISIKNFMKYNECEKFSDEYRCKILPPIELLTDIERYKKLRAKESSLYKETANLLFHLNIEKTTNHKLETICWELWGTNFEAIQFEGYDMSTIREQIKLINLFVTSSAYW